MPFRQIHRLTSAKLMSDTQAHFCKVNDFYWISNNYPSFFLFLPQKTPKIASSLSRSSLSRSSLSRSSLPRSSLPRSSLPPFLLASSLACLLPAPVPPCSQPCLPPPCPRSRKFSSGLQLRAPSLVLPPFPPSLRFITRSPLFAYTFLVHTSAFPFVLFGSPISILLRPHPYCLVLPFSMLTVVFYSFPLLSLTAIDVYSFDIPNTGNLTVTKKGNNCTFVDNVWSLQFFRSFRSPLPPRCCRGERGVESVSLLYREDSCGAYKQEHSCYNHHHRLV